MVNKIKRSDNQTADNDMAATQTLPLVKLCPMFKYVVGCRL